MEVTGALAPAESIAPFGEESRLGQSESVDALLAIADGEQIARRVGHAFGADQAKNRFLQRVDILEFVDEHVAVSLLELPGDG